MNITEYFSEEDTNPSIYRGRMTLKQGYTIADAEESCYKYLGINSALPITALAHPDDAESVREALELVKEREQHLIFRLLSSNGSYRYMYALFRLNGRMLGDFASIDVMLMDILRIHYKFDATFSNVVKYRKLMCFSDKMYFEYYYDKEIITIYEYVNNRSIVRYRDNIANLQAKVLEGEKYNFRQRAEFEVLQEYLKNYAENIDMEVDGEIFGLTGGYLHLKGGIVYLNNARWMMAATITVTWESKRDEKYYMSPHAFDSATGVYNKRAITELTMDVLTNAEDKPVYFCIIDIDDFKNINDTYGHMAGDEVIASVAEILKSTMGARGYIGRFGGDEFVVVTDKISSEDVLLNALKTVRKHVAWINSAELENTEITLSIGIAKYPNDADNYEGLFNLADKCLYLAKAKGKNRFVIYREDQHKDFEMVSDSDKLEAKKIRDIYSSSSRAVVDILGDTGENDREAFDRSIRGVLESFGIDRIAIYMGERYERCYFAGDGVVPMESLTYINQPEIAALFDENNVLLRNKILYIRESSPELYELMERQGTEGFIIAKVQLTGQPPMAVTFDVFERYRKWASNEKDMLYIAAQIIARRFLGLEQAQ